jgi:transposase
MSGFSERLSVLGVIPDEPLKSSKRGRYTLEFKQEAARLVESGQSQAAVARSLGVVEQTLGNWVREHRAGTLKGASSKPQELARVTMERDILGKATAYCVLRRQPL